MRRCPACERYVPGLLLPKTFNVCCRCLTVRIEWSSPWFEIPDVLGIPPAELSSFLLHQEFAVSLLTDCFHPLKHPCTKFVFLGDLHETDFNRRFGFRQVACGFQTHYAEGIKIPSAADRYIRNELRTVLRKVLGLVATADDELLQDPDQALRMAVYFTSVSDVLELDRMLGCVPHDEPVRELLFDAYGLIADNG